MWLRTAVALSLAFCSHADDPWANYDLGELLKTMPEAAFGPVAGMTCEPSVKLDALRFAWIDADGFFMELTHDEALVEKF